MNRSKKYWAGAGLLAVVGAVSLLLAGSLRENIVYFLTPTEIVAQGADAHDRPLRLGGQVKPGSVAWDAEGLDLRFVVQDSAKEVLVHSTGAPPAMFRDGIGVVVEGTLTDEGVFESTNLMVKHSNEYQAPHGDSVPPAMYESLIPADADAASSD